MNDRRPLCTSCTSRFVIDATPVCPRCASSLPQMTAAANICPRCLTEKFAFDAVVRLGAYDDFHRSVILRMKHASGEVLTEALAPLAAEALAGKLAAHKPEIVIPIPLHWKRRWSRGYNQSDVLAQALARKLQLSFQARVLRRVRNTDYQSKRDPEQRKANVRGAFIARGKVDLTGKCVVLVDDVLTTGATANEAARVLRKCGAKTIVVAVLAHEKPM